jgi:hypothetical protein
MAGRFDADALRRDALVGAGTGVAFHALGGLRGSLRVVEVRGQGRQMACRLAEFDRARHPRPPCGRAGRLADRRNAFGWRNAVSRPDEPRELGSGHARNPNSPHLTSRSPYVRWQQDGQALDAFGTKLPTTKHPDAHIPVDEFRFLPELFG